MENQDHNGHGESHDDHATEGNRQYYPQGWWMPLAGLVTVALGFCIIGYFAFNISGTDKWGQHDQTEMHDAHHGDAEQPGHHDGSDVKEDHGKTAPADHKESTSTDSLKPADDAGHDHNSDDHHH